MSNVSIQQQAEVHAKAEHQHQHAANRSDNLKFATWLYLASEVVIFAVLIATFVLFRQHRPEVLQQFHDGIQEWPGIWLVSLNTFLLLSSSWAMVMGLRQIQLGNPSGLMRWIALTALLGAIFVALQYVEYTELSHQGITLYYNQDGGYTDFGMRFYAPTAFHGFHVIVGVIWALYIVLNARRGKYTAANYAGIEVFGLYWHFVDVVWIVLFTVIYLI
ncbi:MAG TPA: heme-copper oxidase subunit III [Phototrophicaceae bacterium]|nr:heme-copper oxidase subunit III [Phototrophicaceae bacterium]